MEGGAMKKLLISVVLVMLAGSLLVGCGGGNKTYSDSGQTISVAVDQEFIIALGSNPTTGYRWEPDFDQAIIALVESKYEPGKKARDGVVGAGGVEFFKFKTLKTGQTRIILSYQRSWETESIDQKVFTIDIK